MGKWVEFIFVFISILFRIYLYLLCRVLFLYVHTQCYGDRPSRLSPFKLHSQRVYNPLFKKGK